MSRVAPDLTDPPSARGFQLARIWASVTSTVLIGCALPIVLFLSFEQLGLLAAFAWILIGLTLLSCLAAGYFAWRGAPTGTGDDDEPG